MLLAALVSVANNTKSFPLIPITHSMFISKLKYVININKYSVNKTIQTFTQIFTYINLIMLDASLIALIFKIFIFNILITQYRN